MKLQYYFEITILFWNYNIILKLQHYFEITILFWNYNIILKLQYYFENDGFRGFDTFHGLFVGDDTESLADNNNIEK